MQCDSHFMSEKKSLPELKVRKLPESLMQTRVLVSPKLTKLKTLRGQYSVRPHNPGPTSRSSIDKDLRSPKSPGWPHVAPPRPTLLSPSMTMTGTAVAGQRCLAGRGLSQFHRTMIWKGQGSLDGWLGYPSRSPSKGSACRNDLVKLHFKVSPHPYTLQTRNLH